eukprot:6004287-Amphidinium_carterae.1
MCGTNAWTVLQRSLGEQPRRHQSKGARWETTTLELGGVQGGTRDIVHLACVASRDHPGMVEKLETFPFSCPLVFSQKVAMRPGKPAS